MNASIEIQGIANKYRMSSEDRDKLLRLLRDTETRVRVPVCVEKFMNGTIPGLDLPDYTEPWYTVFTKNAGLGLTTASEPDAETINRIATEDLIVSALEMVKTPFYKLVMAEVDLMETPVFSSIGEAVTSFSRKDFAGMDCDDNDKWNKWNVLWRRSEYAKALRTQERMRRMGKGFD